MGVPGEVLFLVPPLDVEHAASLFEARAAAVAPSLVIDDDARAAITDICARLDGMPLAIELAASKMRVFTVDQLRERLHDRFNVVTGGSRGSLPRHRTLRAVVDWSYDLLDEVERLVFERLSMFAGGCTLEAAEVVVTGGPVHAMEVPDLVDRLVEKSLVIVNPGPTNRFTMLQTLSEYGRERVTERDEIGAIRRRQTEWLLSEAIAGELRPHRDGELGFMLTFGEELDNLRAALGWAEENEPALAFEVAARLGEFWAHNDAVADGWRVLTAALARSLDLDDEVLALGQVWAGFFARSLGHRDEGTAARNRCP